MKSCILLYRFLIVLFIPLVVFECNTDREIKQKARPNILLILTDDMGYGDVSNIGNPYLKTPHLDKMAKSSINFKYFYVSPVCAPTRASLLTGRFHQEVGVRSVTNGFEIMNPEAVTLAEILKNTGYRTGLFGKWHLGEYYPSTPNAQGFDEFLGFRTGHTSNYYDAVLENNGKMESTKGYITDMFSEKAMKFMSAELHQPFFCYLAYNAPHSPLQIEVEKFKKFLEMGLDEKTSRVYGMVENIDENIGRIFDFLNDSSLLENTIVVFMSDNGPISGWQIPQENMRFNAGLRDQKFSEYEGGIRTQCYWMWKNHWQPFYDKYNLAAHIDVVPTLAAILDISLPDSLGIDGIDLSQVLENHSLLTNERIIFEDFKLSAVVHPLIFDGGVARKGDWKLSNGSELYNLAHDPGEKKDLAHQNPEILKELRELYEKYYVNSYSKSHFFPLPIKVGYDEENPIFIKAHHGKASGNVQMTGFRGNYNENIGTHPTGVDGDWTSNWKMKDDKIEWSVEFIEKGLYEIGMTAKGKIADKSCCFSIETNTDTTKVCLPRMDDFTQWEYIPFERITAGGTSKICFTLLQISNDDSLNINELVIRKIK